MYFTFLTAHMHGTSDLELWDSAEMVINEYLAQDIIPIGMMVFEFDRVKENAMESGLLVTVGPEERYLKDGNLLVSPFEKDSCLLVAPLKTYTDTGDVTFVLPSRLFISGYSGNVLTIEMDFDDGLGWRIVDLDSLINISYANEGQKTLRYRLTTDKGIFGGNTQFKNNNLYKRYTDTDPNLTFTLWDFEAEEAYMGAKAKAHVTISYGCGDGKLRKPLIVVPGFDPTQFSELTGNEMQDYWGFVGGNLLPAFREKIEDQGYDLIYINYLDGGTFIQRNARLLESVIRWVNQQKALNGSVSPNTILGISMGGLVSCYALGEMENNAESHDVETFYTLDSPHNGANIPLSFQAGVYHLRGLNIWIAPGIPIPIGRMVKQVALAKDILENFAAMQMLEDHYFASGNSGRTGGRVDLIAELDAFGLPTQVSSRGRQIRNIAISNGTDVAINQGFNANDQLITLDVQGHVLIPPIPFIFPTIIYAGFKGEVEFRSLPDASQGKRIIYDGNYKGNLLIGLFYARIIHGKLKVHYTNSQTNGRDNAPGAFIDITEFGGTPSISGLTIHQPRFCFVPSVSSAAFVAPYNQNFYYNINSAWDATNKSWQNDESGIDNYSVTQVISGSAVNTFHTDWGNVSRDFFIDNLLPLNNGLPDNPLALSSSASFNFGEGTSDRAAVVEVYSGGFLNINADEPLGLSAPSSSNPNPAAGSHYTTYVSGANCFANAGVQVFNSGWVQVGDNSTSNTADLIFSSGTVLEIFNGGTLSIADNSRVIIEEGASLYFHAGANIVLEGPNAILEFNGKLILGSSAVFNFTKGSASSGGFIRFNIDAGGELECVGTSAKFALVGTSSPTFMDKVLEINGGKLQTPNIMTSASNYLSEFKISNGLVNIGAASELEVSVFSVFENSYFIGLSTVNSVGLHITNPSVFSINNCAFRELGTGLILDLDGLSTNLTLSNLSFHWNLLGLKTEDGGVNLSNCVFANNETGWRAFEMTSHSSVQLTEFLSNDYGIIYENVSPKRLYTEEVNFSQNDIGISSWGEEMELVMQCTRITYSANRGIQTIGTVSISPTLSVSGKTGGDCAFFNNAVDMEISGELYLESGNNVFRNTGANASNTFITGYVPVCNPCAFMNSSFQLYSANNFWDPGYQSSIMVASFPVTNAGFTGTENSSFTSSCFNEGSGGNPVFANLWDAPMYKNNLDTSGKSHAHTNIQILTIYPNPTRSVLYVSGLDKPTKSIYRVIDAKGALIQTGCLTDKAEIDVARLMDGIYILYISSEKSVSHSKFIIQH